MYESHATLIKRAITKSWHILQRDQKYDKLFKNLPHFIYKRGKSIDNQLIRSDIRKKIEKEPSRPIKQALFNA